MNLVLLHYCKIGAHFESFSNSDNRIMRTLATATHAVWRYQMETTIDERHILALLCDPINKNEIVKYLYKTPLQVHKY